MSRPKYYWFGFVKKLLWRYPEQLKIDHSTLSYSAIVAIDKALEETERLPNGAERVELIDLLYFKNAYTLEGAALKLHISTRLAQNWNSHFIYRVGWYMGFL